MVTTDLKENSSFFFFLEGTPGSTQGDFSFSVYKDGVLDALTPSGFTEVAPGAFSIEFVFASTGQWSVLSGTTPVAYVKVQDVDTGSTLKNLEDTAMGSWQWDKSTAKLRFYRQTGEEFAEFDITEDSSIASRERV